MDHSFDTRLAEGESLLSIHRFNGMMLALPVFFVLLSALAFSPLARPFGPGVPIVAWVCGAYGLFTGVIFQQMYRVGRVGLSDRRVLYLQKFPGRSPDLSSWDLSQFNGVMLRKGVFGSMLGYGHILLLNSGRLVTVLRGVNGAAELTKRIETDLLKK